MPDFNTTVSERREARRASVQNSQKSLALQLRRSPSSLVNPVPFESAHRSIAQQLEKVKKRAPIKHPDALGAVSGTISGGGGKAKVEIEYEDPTLIDRRTSDAMPYWDLIMILSLLFAATVTPYEVTYLTEGPCVTPLFIVNRTARRRFRL